MTRPLIAFLATGILLFGTPRRADCAGEEVIGYIAKEIAKEVGKEILKAGVKWGTSEVSKLVLKEIFGEAKKELQTKYSPKLVSVTALPGKAEACLVYSRTVKVVMNANVDGKPESSGKYLENTVEVKVIALYPIKDIRYTADGKVILPQLETSQIHPTFKREGERGSWKYTGPDNAPGWNEFKCREVANTLTLKSLDVARDLFATFQSEVEAEVTQEFNQAVEQLAKDFARKGGAVRKDR